MAARTHQPVAVARADRALAELVANPLSAAALLNTSSLRSQNFSLLSGGLTGGAIVALSSLVGVLLLVNVGKNMYRKGKARGRR